MVINTCQDCHLGSDERSRGVQLEMVGMINALSGLNDSLQFLLSSQPSPASTDLNKIGSLWRVRACNESQESLQISGTDRSEKYT